MALWKPVPKDVHLDASALASHIGRQATVRARDEEARLLYVGVTRARDHVVFAPPAKGSLDWISVLDGNGDAHVELPRAAPGRIRTGDATFPTSVAVLSSDEEPVPRTVAPAYVRVTKAAVERPALHRRPSSAADEHAYRIVERIEFGPRLPLVGEADMRLVGEAVHAVLAADLPAAAGEARLARAQAILDRWGVHQVAVVDVLAACDRLSTELARRWPEGRVHREVPVSAHLADQLVNGRIDLLVEHETGFAIIDHKSFPGSRDLWEARAVGYGPQLGLYAEALGRARPGAASELFVHMPIAGRFCA